MLMISEHVKMLILFGSFCNANYCLFLVIIEKHAPHSRYFSDELGALFIYNNIEHVFTCLVTYGIIPKESIRFRAVKKEQLTQKISCSECDSFRLYQFAGLSWIPYGKSILPRK